MRRKNTQQHSIANEITKIPHSLDLNIKSMDLFESMFCFFFFFGVFFLVLHMMIQVDVAVRE